MSEHEHEWQVESVGVTDCHLLVVCEDCGHRGEAIVNKINSE